MNFILQIKEKIKLEFTKISKRIQKEVINFILDLN